MASVLVAVRSAGTVAGSASPDSPAALARRLDPKFVVTQTIQMLSDLAVWTVTWALMREDVLVVLVS